MDLLDEKGEVISAINRRERDFEKPSKARVRFWEKFNKEPKEPVKQHFNLGRMIALRKSGLSLREIGYRLNVSRTTVMNYLKKYQ